MGEVNEEVPTKREGGWGWFVAIGMAIMLIVTAGPLGSFGFLFGEFLESLGEGTQGITVVSSINFLCFSFTGLLTNYSLKSFSCRQVCLLGAFLFLIGNLITVFVTNMSQMTVSYGIIPGIGMGLMVPATFQAFNTYFERRRTFAMSISQAIIGAGCMVYPLLTEWLMASYGFRGAQAILTALSFNTIFASLIMRTADKQPTATGELPLKAGARELTGELPLKAGAHELTGQLPLKAGARELTGELPLKPGAHELTGELPLKAGAHELTGELPLKAGARELTDVVHYSHENINHCDKVNKDSQENIDCKQENERSHVCVDLSDQVKEDSQNIVVCSEQNEKDSRENVKRSDKEKKNSQENINSSERSEKESNENIGGLENEQKDSLKNNEKWEKGKDSHEYNLHCEEDKKDYTAERSIEDGCEESAKDPEISLFSSENHVEHVNDVHVQKEHIPKEDEALLPQDSKGISKPSTNAIHEKRGSSASQASQKVVRKFLQMIVDFFDLTLLTDPVYVNIVLGNSCAFFADITFFLLLPLILLNLDFSKTATALCMSMGAAGDLIGRLFLIGLGLWLPTAPSRLLLWIGALMSVLCRIVFTWVSSFIAVSILTTVLGFFRAWIMVTGPLVFAEYNAARFPSAFGLYMVINGLIAIVAGPLVGWIRDSTNSYIICTHALSALTTVCVVLWAVEAAIARARRDAPDLV